MSGLGKQGWKLEVALVVVACLLLPWVEISYTARYFGIDWEDGQASLIHLHFGVLFAVAVSTRNRWVVAACLLAMLLLWHARVLEAGQWSWFQGTVTSISTLACWWWTLQCARWAGGPYGTQRRFGMADLPRFIGAGFVVFPLGWVALASLENLLIWGTPALAAGEGMQQFLAKYNGVAGAALPLLLFWTDGYAGRGRHSRVFAAWAWLGAAMLLWLLFQRLPDGMAREVFGGLFDYRLIVAVLMGTVVLVLRPAWSMPLLVIVHVTMLHALTQLAQQSDDVRSAGLLLLHTFELNMLSLAMVGLYLADRERTQALRDAEVAGRHDATTGLANANALREAWESLREPPSSLGFLVLDHADRLVSSYGWPAQTEMLRELIPLMAPARAYYLGGAQFVLLPQQGAEHGEHEPWNDLLSRLRHHEFVWQGARLSVTPYLGLARPRTLDMGHLHQCMADACDAAMQARQRGETVPVTAAHGLVADAAVQARRETLLIQSDALASIRDGRILLHVQPIVRIDGAGQGSGRRGEILCRLLDEDGGLIPPNRFVATLEAGGRAAELDLAVIEALFEQLRKYPQDDDLSDRISINLSGSSLSSDSFRSRLFGLLRQSPVPLPRLCFELTETAAISRFEFAVRLFAELREMGCKLALDDFGSGLHNFERLRRMPVDMIKIDAHLVRQVTARGSDFKVVQATIAVARAYGMETVAEGIEDGATLDCLRGLGVEWGQGNHLGEAGPLETFLRSRA
jgi:EAL domain-containing protein (putative c-di-GMP-specific phosphodiesterase class I)/GGDEF domain-containing protein